MIVAITKEPLGTVVQLWEEQRRVDEEEADRTVQEGQGQRESHQNDLSEGLNS